MTERFGDFLGNEYDDDLKQVAIDLTTVNPQDTEAVMRLIKRAAEALARIGDRTNA